MRSTKPRGQAHALTGWFRTPPTTTTGTPPERAPTRVCAQPIAPHRCAPPPADAFPRRSHTVTNSLYRYTIVCI